jgi:AcrR family transcriptional regulator
MYMGLREQKKLRTQAALQDAAMDLFGRHGFDQTTVEEIAAACDVSPRTFFRYYATKEDVLFVDSQQRCAALLEIVAAQPFDDPPLDVLHRSLHDLALGYERERDRHVARARVLERSPSLRADKAEQQRGWESTLFEELERRNRATVTPLTAHELRLRAAVSMAAFRTVFDTWIDDPDTDFVRMLDDSFDQLARGLA